MKKICICIAALLFSSCIPVKTIKLSPDVENKNKKLIQKFDKNRADMEAQLKNRINTYLKDKEGSVAVSLNIKHLDFYYGKNDHVKMHAASTMKVPVMIEVFRQAAAGKFNLDDSISVKNKFSSIIDGSPYSMELSRDSNESLYDKLNKKESIYNLTYEMIITSSNLATNLLIDLVGAQNVQATMRKIGAQEIQVLRGVEDIKAFEAGKNNTTSAYDLTLIMQAILDGDNEIIKNCDRMIKILSDQKFKTKIPAQLPASVKVAHKTGSITEIDHDTAIIYPTKKYPYVLTILTKGIAQHEDAQKTIAGLSEIIYNWYMEI